MATSWEKVIKYARKEYLLPQDYQGVGCVEGKDGCFVMLGFSTKREIITEIGYCASVANLTILHACMNAVCDLVEGKAVLCAKLPQREAIAACLSDDGKLSEKDVPYAVMAELALRYALYDYAKKRTSVTL